MSSILHITPSLPPAVCGVGDYATVVGTSMEQSYSGLGCGYLAAGYRQRRLARAVCTSDWLWQEIGDGLDSLPAANRHGDSVIVLHYSGYGYSPDGAPAWLATALESRPAWGVNIRIATFFHELYANGWPWKRAFWQSSRQRSVAIRIARASDRLLTNRGESAAWLERVTGRPAGSVPHLPVPSNVGEPVEVPGYFDRPPQGVVFGGLRFKRPFVQGRGAKTTAGVCQKLGLTRLVDIGKPIDIDRKPFAKAGVEIAQMGYLEKEQVSQQLSKSRVGFFDYFPNHLEKSGILAALAAHGVAPLAFEPIERRIAHQIDASECSVSLATVLLESKLAKSQQRLAELAACCYEYSHRSTLRLHAINCLRCFEPEPAVLHC